MIDLKKSRELRDKLKIVCNDHQGQTVHHMSSDPLYLCWPLPGKNLLRMLFSIWCYKKVYTPFSIDRLNSFSFIIKKICYYIFINVSTRITKKLCNSNSRNPCIILFTPKYILFYKMNVINKKILYKTLHHFQNTNLVSESVETSLGKFRSKTRSKGKSIWITITLL